MLLLPRLVADGGPDGDLRAALLVDAALAADEDAEAALLEDGDVVVVGVAHGPARGVLLRLLRRGRVDEAAVPVGPLLEGVEALALQESCSSQFQPEIIIPPIPSSYWRAHSIYPRVQIMRN